jgi:hypothetical protein
MQKALLRQKKNKAPKGNKKKGSSKYPFSPIFEPNKKNNK